MMRRVRLGRAGRLLRVLAAALLACGPGGLVCGADPRQDGSGEVKISGELRQWHKITLDVQGPWARETDNAPNPFLDFRLTGVFRHGDGVVYRVPGYFAADGQAANTSAAEGRVWRIHFAPDRVGPWDYAIEFVRGNQAALEPELAGTPVPGHDARGTLHVQASDKQGRDLRGQGRLQYVGQRYLRFAGSGRYFLKAGADAPETLLAYEDFDNTVAGLPRKAPLKSWAPHLRDWTKGDPTWRDGRGKGLIGAVNYLSAKGCNAFSFLTYNAGGDGDNVWPFVERDDKLHYDCSKLDQWGVVFDHACRKGMYLHFKLQETENDDQAPEALDGGDLGVERSLYLRELAARFAHHPALNWNLGEENTQSTEQQLAMSRRLQELDPYDHLIVVHTFPNQQEKVYAPLLGGASPLRGCSLQNDGIEKTHEQTVYWVRRSTNTGTPWVVAFDESGTAAHGQCPDLGYRGFDGRDRTGTYIYTEHDVRRETLWGALMGGAAGVEYYFGYQFAENDLRCEDWRSRDRSWDYCRHALQFFQEHVPFPATEPADELLRQGNQAYCLAARGACYVVYLGRGGTVDLNLEAAEGEYLLRWFDPRTGDLPNFPVRQVKGGGVVRLGPPPAQPLEDWVAWLSRVAEGS